MKKKNNNVISALSRSKLEYIANVEVAAMQLLKYPAFDQYLNFITLENDMPLDTIKNEEMFHIVPLTVQKSQMRK